MSREIVVVRLELLIFPGGGGGGGGGGERERERERERSRPDGNRDVARSFFMMNA